jgi:hippurate hydrolase
MNDALRDTIRALLPAVTALRRELHQQPELHFEETRTAARIAQFLDEAGIAYTAGHADSTGIVAELPGNGEGGTVALRADMDALAIDEATGCEWTSREPGRMHACGHDGHMACLCGAAKALAAHPDLRRNRVRLIFQPGEEGAAGGRRIVEEGLLDGVGAVFALHGWPGIPAGSVAVHERQVMASGDFFQIHVSGRGGHGANPGAAIDPVLIAAHIVTALQAVVSRETHPWDAAVVSICRVDAGTASNIIPGKAVMEGTFRTLSPETRTRTAEAIERIATETARAFRGSAEVIFGENGYPPLSNDPAMSRFVRETAAALFGEDAVITPDHAYMTAEDFAFYLEKIPGAFLLLGVDDPEGEAAAPLHNPGFDFNDNALETGIRLLTALALDWPGRCA